MKRTQSIQKASQRNSEGQRRQLQQELVADSDTTMPVSLSLSQDLPFSTYTDICVRNSRVTLSSLEPMTSKMTLASGSQTGSLRQQSTNFPFAKKQPLASLDPDSLVLGEGEDYFLSLFGESKKLTATHSSISEEMFAHLSVILEEVGKCTSSSLGDIQIAEVNIKGLFVKLLNSSSDKEVDIGHHILQQNVNGHAISVYHFCPDIPMQANTTVTVWAAAAEAKHQPPTDFVWKEQDRFRSSPDCTTILCQPHGEAIAWYTPIHWKQAWEKLQTDIEFDRCSVVSSTLQSHMFRWAIPTAVTSRDKEVATRKEPSKYELEQASTPLKKQKEIPPTLFPNRSPWCHSPSFPAHPYCPLIEPLDPDTTESTSEKQLESRSARRKPAPRDQEKMENRHQNINRHSTQSCKEASRVTSILQAQHRCYMNDLCSPCRSPRNVSFSDC